MKIQAVVDEELGERIKTLAAQDGRSVSQWVARALACWVEGVLTVNSFDPEQGKGEA